MWVQAVPCVLQLRYLQITFFCSTILSNMSNPQLPTWCRCCRSRPKCSRHDQIHCLRATWQPSTGGSAWTSDSMLPKACRCFLLSPEQFHAAYLVVGPPAWLQMPQPQSAPQLLEQHGSPGTDVRLPSALPGGQPG